MTTALFGVHSKVQPSMMQPLLRRLVFDVPYLTDYNKMALKVDKLQFPTVCMKNIPVYPVKMYTDHSHYFNLPALD